MVSLTAATFYFYKSFWSVLRSQALETAQLGFHELNPRKSCWTWQPGSAPKPPTPSPEPSLEPCWTWPGSAPKPPRPSSEPCWAWPGFPPKPPTPSPEPSEPSPEPRWTWPGPCTSAHRSYSGLKTPLAYAENGKAWFHMFSPLTNVDLSHQQWDATWCNHPHHPQLDTS